jgi:NAD-dependent deacetylase
MDLEHARAWISQARSVAVLTGAGVSAESGVPTFRGPGGVWRTYRAEDLATPQGFARDPRLVWEWYDWRRQIISKVDPNAAHRALAELERRKPSFTLITQNVDGLHDRAGSQRILKLHGDIWQLRCTVCRKEWHDARVPLGELPPRCACGAMARPGVVWFGESLPAGVLEQAERAVREAEVVLVAGTSAVVYPAAGLIPFARHSGAKVIEVNLEATPFSSQVDCSLAGKAGEILPMLLT